MALVFAGIAPHTPLIVPSIGHEHVALLKKTRQAMEELAAALYAAQPETLLILTPHSQLATDAFTISYAERFQGTLDEFGDYSLKVDLPADLAFGRRIASRASDYQLPAVLRSVEKLDYGATVPLLFLSEHLPKLKIAVVSDSTLSPKDHFRFGSMLREEIVSRRTRIAVLASADLTNRDKAKPYEIIESVEPYDAAILRALEQQNGKALLEIPPTIPHDANECGFHALLMLFGVIEGIQYRTRVFIHESPVGVGFLVASLTPV